MHRSAIEKRNVSRIHGTTRMGQPRQNKSKLGSDESRTRGTMVVLPSHIICTHLGNPWKEECGSWGRWGFDASSIIAILRPKRWCQSILVLVFRVCMQGNVLSNYSKFLTSAQDGKKLIISETFFLTSRSNWYPRSIYKIHTKTFGRTVLTRSNIISDISRPYLSHEHPIYQNPPIDVENK
jgi:hypothetical protein